MDNDVLILNELVNKELSFFELDLIMEGLGFDSERDWLNDNDWDEIANNKRMTYSKNGENCVTILFEVLFTHREDETSAATEIKIANFRH